VRQEIVTGGGIEERGGGRGSGLEQGALASHKSEEGNDGSLGMDRK